MQSNCLVSCLLLLAGACSAQVCMPESQPQTDSGYGYIRAEVNALQWIRRALNESDKIQPVHTNDPERFHKTVNLYTTIQTVSDDYDCATAMLRKYKDSKDQFIAESVDSLLTAIDNTKTINADLVGMMELLNKARKPEDIDETAIAKTLANIKGLQQDVRTISLLAVKISAFSVVRIEGDGDDAKPTAFTITPKQRATLMAEVQELARNKGKSPTYVDLCAEILLNTLTKQLPTTTALKTN